MRKFSFGKKNDHPIPQKNTDDFNDLDELDFDDDMESEEKNEKKLNLNEKRNSIDKLSEISYLFNCISKTLFFIFFWKCFD